MVLRKHTRVHYWYVSLNWVCVLQNIWLQIVQCPYPTTILVKKAYLCIEVAMQTHMSAPRISESNSRRNRIHINCDFAVPHVNYKALLTMQPMANSTGERRLKAGHVAYLWVQLTTFAFWHLGILTHIFQELCMFVIDIAIPIDHAEIRL